MKDKRGYSSELTRTANSLVFVVFMDRIVEFYKDSTKFKIDTGE